MDLLHKSCMALGTPGSLHLFCECPRALPVTSSRHPDAIRLKRRTCSFL